MRPEEIDFSNFKKHYFDVSNGEVLAGVAERTEYIQAGGDKTAIIELGKLLRNPVAFVDAGATYEPLNTSSWSPEQYEAHARWLGKMALPSEHPQGTRLTRETFVHARRFGIGPSHHAIKKTFGNYGNLYRAAQVADTRIIGMLDDWDVDQAVAFVRKIGRGRRPTAETFRKWNKANPNNPKAEYLHERFKHIGGLQTLIELAGYHVVERWDHDDYVHWGVQCMEANDGRVPTALMANYLSTQGRGPAASTIVNHFGRMSSFQREVAPRFYDQQQELAREVESFIGSIADDVRSGVVTLELFSPFPHEPGASEARRAEIRQAIEAAYSEEPFAAIMRQLGAKEAITRYAKYKVLTEVTNKIEAAGKITISRDAAGKNFVNATRNHEAIPPGDIECAALTMGFFDYIWPADAPLQALKLGKGYIEYLAKLEAADRARRRARSGDPVAV